MVLPFLPRRVSSLVLRVGKRRRTQRGNVLRLIQIRLAAPSLAKITPASQDNSPQARISDSSSKNAVSFLSIHACGEGSKRSCVRSTQLLEFRPGGVRTRVGSVERSLRSSLISNSKQPSLQAWIVNQIQTNDVTRRCVTYVRLRSPASQR